MCFYLIYLFAKYWHYETPKIQLLETQILDNFYHQISGKFTTN